MRAELHRVPEPELQYFSGRSVDVHVHVHTQVDTTGTHAETASGDTGEQSCGTVLPKDVHRRREASNLCRSTSDIGGDHAER